MAYLPRSCSRLIVHGLVLVAVLLALPACSSPSNGSLVVDWTINSTSDASLCNKEFGWVVVQLAYSSGDHYSSSNGSCSSFSTSFGGVPSDTYTVTGYMFNADTNATMSKASPRTVDVSTEATSTILIDFPLAATN
jgi:hypothetical protein